MPVCAIPDVVVQRFPLYYRLLNELRRVGVDIISSDEISQMTNISPSQVRKDIAYLGRLGLKGKGFDVNILTYALRETLGLNSLWNTLVVGLGRVGRAVVEYPGMAPEGFIIVSVFDNDERVIGTKVRCLTVLPMSRLADNIANFDIKLGIVAVPAPAANTVIETLIAAGIKGILNYTPVVPLSIPKGVFVENMDPVVLLQYMTYHINRTEKDITA